MANVSKRSFLKFMGGAAVGGKHVAKQIAEQAGVSFGTGNGGYLGCGDPSALSSGDAGGMTLGKWLMKNALPSWKLEEIRQNSKRVHFLDPDLAALQSFSMTAKIGIQQQRNFDRSINDLKGWAMHDEVRREWCTKHGFWL
jgi:hypothetical protein